MIILSKMQVAVLFGGVSSEHEVSRVSAGYVVRELDRALYTVHTVGITKDGRWLYYTGDDALLRECAEYLYALGELFDDRVDEFGRLLFNDERLTGKPVFLDWQTADLPETEQGVSALLRIAVVYDIPIATNKATADCLLK